MKNIFLMILLLLFGLSNCCFAEKYYLYIDKKSVPDPGEEIGQAEAGDIVTAKLYDPLKPPSESEENFYEIRIVDLLQLEFEDLLSPEFLNVDSRMSEIVPKDKYDIWLGTNSNRVINKKTDIGGNYVVEFSMSEAKEIVRFRKKKVDLKKLLKDKELKKDDFFKAVIDKPSIVVGIVP